ncbi:MAG: ABC-2 type transport system permease protein [Lentimonas sp.]|jgi:ABC-2 type transport system permease protein
MAEKKSQIKGVFNWTFFAVVIACLILVNIVSSFVNTRIDATKDNRFSLSNGTIEYLENEDNFNNRLLLKIYLDGNLPASLSYFKEAIEDKLKEFKEHTGKRIEYEFINPNAGTEGENRELWENLYNKAQGIIPMDITYSKEGSQSQMTVWPGALIEYGGSTVNVIQFLPGTTIGKPYQMEGMGEVIQNSVNNLEYILVSSIRKAVEDKKPVIGILQGHGELNFQQTQRARALISPYYVLREIDIKDSLAALNGVDGLIIANPKSQISDKELYIIDQFVMRGGRLMCFLDALKIPEDTLQATGITHTLRNKTGLDKMLFDYGLKINDNLVIDAQCAPKAVPFAKQSIIPWFYNVLASTTSHPIARNLEPVSLEYVNEIQFVGNSETIALTPVLTSSTNSTRTGMAPMVSLAMPLNYGKDPKLVPNPKEETNKLCLAGLAEGYFTSHFKNRIVDDFVNSPLIKYNEKSSKEGKVFLVGNGRFIENDFDSTLNAKGTQYIYKPKPYNDLRFDPKVAEMGIRLFYGNPEFFQNTVDYLMGDNSVLDIRSRQIDIHKIDKSKLVTSAGFYKTINMILPSAVVLLLALMFFYIRKKKYAQ